MNNTYKILKILKENTEISGSVIGDKLGISRMAVNKHIVKLKNMGYGIKSVKNRGYSLLKRDVLTDIEVYYYLEKNDVTLANVFVQNCESTNTVAKNYVAEGKRDFVVVAPIQLKGKGRLGRIFDSKEGGAYFSYALSGNGFNLADAPFMTILTAIALKRTFTDIGVNVKLKWPNDIYANGKKLVGILSEVITSGLEVDSFILGIGTNIYNSLDGIEYIAISLKQLGKKIDRASFIARVIYNINNVIVDYKRFGAERLIEEYKSASNTIKKEIIVINGETKYDAFCEGITNQGYLLVSHDGGIQTLFAGDVSVRAKE